MTNKKNKDKNIRILKITRTKAGGNASKYSYHNKIQIPNDWCNKMNIEMWDRELELKFDEKTKVIIIKKVEKTKEEIEEACKKFYEEQKNKLL